MDLNSFSPYVRVALNSRITAPWKLRERVIFDYELLYVKGGRARITVEDRAYDAKAGDVFLFKPGQRHSIEIQGEEDFWQPHLHFDFFYDQYSREIKVSFFPPEEIDPAFHKYFRADIATGDFFLPDKLPLRNISYLEELLFAIIRENAEKLPFYQLRVKSLWFEMFAYIAKECHGSGNRSGREEELGKIREYIAANCHREISLEELARVFRISKYYLLKLFKQTFGLTPIRYHKAMRIQLAKEQIQFSGASITEIADRFGFSSVNAFSRAFKNIEGVSPAFYRYGKLRT